MKAVTVRMKSYMYDDNVEGLFHCAMHRLEFNDKTGEGYEKRKRYLFLFY